MLVDDILLFYDRIHPRLAKPFSFLLQLPFVMQFHDLMVSGRMFSNSGNNTRLDWSLPGSFKCSKWGKLSLTDCLVFAWLRGFWTEWLLWHEGIVDRRIFLDSFIGRPNNDCCSAKWCWHFLALPFCGIEIDLLLTYRSVILVLVLGKRLVYALVAICCCNNLECWTSECFS